MCRKIVFYNRLGFWLGLMVCFGLTLIANFQLEIDKEVHNGKCTCYTL